ncbi:MAG: histidinol-phosphate transaminase [Bacteroidota bacterium]|nr:histidinol-phosphate transaminase [Bacteroidota bacterium]
MIYGHGNELSLYDSEIIADFSSNVSFEPVSPKLIKHLVNEITCINNYPEPDARSLVSKLAKRHRVPEENVLVTNGSCEAFYLLARLFQENHSCIPIPSFSEYEDACMMHNHKISYIDNKNLKTDFNGYDIVWIGNPNNPDGKTIPKETIEQYCKANPNVYFIIDEAYAELCAGFKSSLSLTKKYKNLIIIHSLTKTFSIPGIRIGYIITNRYIIQNLKKFIIPWNVNAIAIKAGNYILDKYNSLLPDTKIIFNNSFRLQARLNEIKSFEVMHSKCNYFLVRLLKGRSDGLKDFLIKEKSILIRDASNFKGLDNTWIRIATQKTAYNNLLFESLVEWTQL